MIVNISKFRNSADFPEAKRLYTAGDRIGAARILARYDVVDPRKNIEQRRHAEPEHYGEDRILRPYDRAKLINLTRDAERNSSTFRGMILQLKLNVAGETKIQVNTADPEFNSAAAFWFNSIFSKECDALGDLNLNELAQLIVAARFREGDCLAVWDPFGDGEAVVAVFESDQLVGLPPAQLDELRGLYPWLAPDAECADGVIRDGFGRVIGYAVRRDHVHNAYEGTAKDTTLFPRSKARLLYSPWRFDQYRGIPDFSAAIADVEDAYEMRTKELQSAKLASSLVFAYISQDKADAIIDMANSDLLEQAFTEDASPSTDGIGSTLAVKKESPEHEQFATLTGAQSEVLAPGEDIKELNANRPNLNTDAFYRAVNQSAGAGVGLGKCYTLMEVSSSYTAFRGEMVLTWTMFRAVQKWLERHFLDWIGSLALEYAVDSGLLPRCTDPLWRHKLSWSFPVMPAVDPDKEASAHEKCLRNGLEDYSEILGPDWKTKFDALAAQIQHAKAEGIPLAILQTSNGTVIEQTTEEEITDADV